MFLSFEAYSCGFVNLGTALALCEKAHPRLPATFGRLFLNGIGSCFRVYDDRGARNASRFSKKATIQRRTPRRCRHGRTAAPSSRNA